MFKSKTASRMTTVALCAAVAACSSPEPVAYSEVGSSSYLASNRQDESGRVPYRYSTAVDWQTYNRIILDPVAIYRGRDQQFEDMSEADKSTLANYMQNQFAEKLRNRFTLATDPAWKACSPARSSTPSRSTTRRRIASSRLLSRSNIRVRSTFLPPWGRWQRQRRGSRRERMRCLHSSPILKISDIPYQFPLRPRSRGMDRFIDCAAVTVIAMLCLQAASLFLHAPRPL